MATNSFYTAREAPATPTTLWKKRKTPDPFLPGITPRLAAARAVPGAPQHPTGITGIIRPPTQSTKGIDVLRERGQQYEQTRPPSPLPGITPWGPPAPTRKPPVTTTPAAQTAPGGRLEQARAMGRQAEAATGTSTLSPPERLFENVVPWLKEQGYATRDQIKTYVQNNINRGFYGGTSVAGWSADQMTDFIWNLGKFDAYQAPENAQAQYEAYQNPPTWSPSEFDAMVGMGGVHGEGASANMPTTEQYDAWMQQQLATQGRFGLGLDDFDMSSTWIYQRQKAQHLVNDMKSKGITTPEGIQQYLRSNRIGSYEGNAHDELFMPEQHLTSMMWQLMSGNYNTDVFGTGTGAGTGTGTGAGTGAGTGTGTGTGTGAGTGTQTGVPPPTGSDYTVAPVTPGDQPPAATAITPEPYKPPPMPTPPVMTPAPPISGYQGESYLETQRKMDAATKYQYDQADKEALDAMKRDMMRRGIAGSGLETATRKEVMGKLAGARAAAINANALETQRLQQEQGQFTDASRMEGWKYTTGQIEERWKYVTALQNRQAEFGAEMDMKDFQFIESLKTDQWKTMIELLQRQTEFSIETEIDKQKFNKLMANWQAEFWENQRQFDESQNTAIAINDRELALQQSQQHQQDQANLWQTIIGIAGMVL